MSAREDYTDGYSYGVQWAEEDRRNYAALSDEEERLHEETMTEQRWARAFYLGALRGYRSVARTLKAGRWGL